MGVRKGAEWLASSLLHEDARLGSITQIVTRSGGELAIVGTRAAVFLPPSPGAPRAVAFAEPAGRAELVEWPDGQPRFVDRGGGGWRTGALIGTDGRQSWRPDDEMGMNDLAAGDLDGDGTPEFVVGYNGWGGVRLLDASGKERWREDDGNVWHVEILDANADGKPEIVHSNASGLMTLRDAGGRVMRRLAVERYLSNFSPVSWPQGTGLLHIDDGRTSIIDFDGRARTELETPETSAFGQARGTVALLDGGRHLVMTASQSHWDRAQLFVFDQGNVLRYREVLAAECVAVAAPEADSFLLGCGSRVLRYARAAAR